MSISCDQCRKEERGFLLFLKPRGWMKHKTPDGSTLYFCSLTCFRRFTGELVPKPAPLEKPLEVVVEQEEPLVAAPAQ